MYMLLVDLEDEGALGGLDVEGAPPLQRVAEGGPAERDPAQRGHVLGGPVVEQLVPALLVPEPALLPGPQGPPLLLKEPTQPGGGRRGPVR